MIQISDAISAFSLKIGCKKNGLICTEVYDRLVKQKI